MTTDEQIAHGIRVEQFLADEVVRGALTKLEEKYVAAWKKSTSAGERETLHAKAQVLDDLQTELRTIVDNGKRAYADAKRRGLRS